MNKRESIVSVIILGLMLSCLLFVGESSAQNRGVSSRAGRKASTSKRTGKNSKINNKRKDRDGREEYETEKEPRVVHLAPRTGVFNSEGPISKIAQSFGVTPAAAANQSASRGKKNGREFDGEPLIKDDENNEIEVDRVVPGAGPLNFADDLAEKSREQKFSILSPQAMPGPSVTFNGILNTEVAALFGSISMPPDTVGDVGPNHYVQATNFGVYRVFDKTGTALTPIRTISTLFASLPANDICRTRNDGDPVVNYDPMADRWVISQFYSVAPYGQCIAVSQTSDPTGAWYAYDFQAPNSNFADYPHWAVWTDGYYLAVHEFGGSPQTYKQGGFFAFNRNKMLAGDPTANYVYFSDTNSFGSLPADIDGYMPPPAGTSEYFMEFDSTFYGGSDRIITHELKPDFTTPANSTFTLKSDVAIAPHDPREPSGRTDIEQPVVPSTSYLDSIAGRAMFRVAYRNLGTSASPVNSYAMNWTVNVSGVTPSNNATYQAGIRWEELRRDNAGALSVFDQGTHAPDPASGTGRNRWVGSIAQDNKGNMGLGFSRSGSGASDFPDIVWAGRTNNVANSGTLNEGETTMHASTGYQNINNSRWGDYAAMNVDPTDDCTFWFTSEWRDSANNSSVGNAPFFWSTRIGSFKFPSCTAAPKGQISATVTNCATGQPVVGADVVANAGGFLRRTNASGNLISNIIAAPGTYTVSAFRKGYTSTTSTSVTVTDGNTTNASICLDGGFPIVELNTTPVAVPTDENANGRLDPGETATVDVPLRNVGGLDATNVSATLTTTTPGVTILPLTTKQYPDIAKEVGVSSSATPFRIKLESSFVCGTPINFTLTVNYNGTNAANTFNFTIATLNQVNVSTTLDTTAPPSSSLYTATTGTQTGRLSRSGVGSTCAAAKANPGVIAGDTTARRYDAYTFTALSSGCFTVTVTQSGTALYSAAYSSGGFVPATPSANFLADPGSSTATMTYSFNVTAGQNFTVVVHDVTPPAGVGQNYTLNISGAPVAGSCTTYTPTVISYTPLAHQATPSNPTIPVTITSPLGVPTSGATAPRVYYRKQGTTTYSSNACAFTGGSATNGTFDCTIDYSLIGGVTAPNSITYFVAAQDTAGVIASNPLSALGTNVNNITSAPPAPNLYTVGDGATVPGAAYTNVNLGNETLGGDSTVYGALNLGGIFNTGAFTLLIECGGSVSGGGENNYIVGTERKNFCGAQSFTFNVGTISNSLANAPAIVTTGYSPVTANVTAAANPSGLTVSDTDAFLPGSNTSNSASRFWTLTEIGAITADLSFTYTDNDVVGNEATYTVLRREGTATASVGGTNNPATNTATVNGVTQFSQWAVGAPAAPTAATVNIGGRVTTSDGRAVAGAVIKMTDASGNVRSAMTSADGNYRFTEVTAGETYILRASGKGYGFTQPTQVVNATGDETEVNFIARPFGKER
jgi:hypothetical protein